MDEGMEMTIFLGREAYNFRVCLLTAGYIHKFSVFVNGIDVVYEPDEERNYRAVVAEADNCKITAQHIELIRAIGDKFQNIQMSL